MSFTGENLLLYFNFLAIATIGFSLIGGFLKGFFKTTYYFIWTFVVLVGGFILMPFVTSWLMTYDLSRFDGLLPSSIDVTLTTIKETSINFIINENPSMANVLVAGSDSLNMVLGLIQMILNLVYILVLYILNLTLFKLLGFIVYLVVKPSKKDKDGNKRKKHRYLGALMGGLRGVFAVILLAIPFSGIVSIGNSVAFLLEEDEPTIQMMITEDGYGFVSYADQPIETSDLLIFLEGYRETYVGQIAGFIKLGDASLDEYVFDSLFSVKTTVDGKKETVKFRQELVNVAKIYQILTEINEGSNSFDEAFLYKLTRADVIEVFDLIEKLEIIKVVIPIGIEYFVNSGEFDELITGYEDIISESKLKAINLVKDIKGVGNIFADLLTLLDENTGIENINYFTLDGNTVSDVLTQIGDLEVVNQLLPILFNFLLETDEMTKILADQGLTKNDIIIPTAAKLKNEFSNLGTLYVSFQALGITSSEDFNNLSDKVFINTISDQSISDFVEALMSFEIIGDNSDLIVDVMYDFMFDVLPIEYQTLFDKTEMKSYFNKEEITSLVLLSKVLISAGLIDETFDYTQILTDDNIEKLSTRISESNLISNKMSDLIEILLDNFGLDLTLVVPANLEFYGAAGKTEIESLLKATKVILDAGLLDPGFSFTALSDQEIEDISTHLTGSEIIKANLSSIIEKTTDGLNLDFEINLTDVEWTQTELESLLKSMKILMSNGANADAIFNLTEQEIKTIAKSKVLSNTFGDVITDMSAPGGSLAGLISIPTELVWYSTNTESGELEHLLLALGELNVSGDGSNLDLDIDVILSKDLDLLFNSKIIEYTIVDNIDGLIETGALASYIEPKYLNNDPYDWYMNENPSNLIGDTKPLLNSFKALSQAGISYDDFTYNAMLAALATPANVDLINDALIDSNILHNSLKKMLTQLLVVEASLNVTINSNDEANYFIGDGLNTGELKLLLNGMVAANEFSTFDYLTLNAGNKATFKFNLLEMNKSHILRQLLDEISDSSLLNSASDYKVSPKPVLNESMWATEIDVLVDLLVVFNSGFDLSALNITTMNDAQADELKVVMDLMAQSRLLEVSKISDVIKSGFESVFNTTLSPLGEVSAAADSYAVKVDKWTNAVSGEVNKIVYLIKTMDDISPVAPASIKGSTPADTAYAISLGEFLDFAETSSMLNPVVEELALSVIPVAYHGAVDTVNNTYVQIMITIHDLMW